MSIVIVSESFIVKDSLNNLFSEIFKSDEILNVSKIDIEDKSYLPHMNLVVIDSSINQNDLLNYIQIIKKINKNIKVIILDFKCNKELFGKSVKLGIEGYIINILDKEEFTYIIKKIMSGKKFYDSELLQHSMDVNYGTRNSLLTSRELCVLSYVSKGLSNRDIANSLGVTEYTIKKHVSSILTKLKLRNRQDIIIYVRDNKIVNNIV